MTRRILTTLAVLALVTSAFGAGWFAHRPPQPTGSNGVPNVIGTPQPTGSSGVPNVIGLTTDQADLLLQQAGLLLEVRPVGGMDRVITTQLPAPGAKLVPGTSVHVSARCFAIPCPAPTGAGETIYDPCTCASR